MAIPNWNSYLQIKILGSWVRTSQAERCGTVVFEYTLKIDHVSWKWGIKKLIFSFGVNVIKSGLSLNREVWCVHFGLSENVLRY